MRALNFRKPLSITKRQNEHTFFRLEDRLSNISQTIRSCAFFKRGCAAALAAVAKWAPAVPWAKEPHDQDRFSAAAAAFARVFTRTRHAARAREAERSPAPLPLDVALVLDVSRAESAIFCVWTRGRDSVKEEISLFRGCSSRMGSADARPPARVFTQKRRIAPRWPVGPRRTP